MRSSAAILLVTNRSEGHLLVVTRLCDDAELVKVEIATVVDVIGGGVASTPVVLAAGVAVEVGAAGCEVVVGVVTSPFAVAQYREYMLRTVVMSSVAGPGVQSELSLLLMNEVT